MATAHRHGRRSAPRTSPLTITSSGEAVEAFLNMKSLLRLIEITNSKHPTMCPVSCQGAVSTTSAYSLTTRLINAHSMPTAKIAVADAIAYRPARRPVRFVTIRSMSVRPLLISNLSSAARMAIAPKRGEPGLCAWLVNRLRTQAIQ